VTLLPLLLIYNWLELASADFFYEDFNRTTGIMLNGHAATSSCSDLDKISLSKTHALYPDGSPGVMQYSPTHGQADTWVPLPGMVTAEPGGQVLRTSVDLRISIQRNDLIRLGSFEGAFESRVHDTLPFTALEMPIIDNYTSGVPGPWTAYRKRGPLDIVQDETNTHVGTRRKSTSTEDAALDAEVNAHPVFGHKDQHTVRPSPKQQCPVRIRLTGSNPFEAGSMWYTRPLPLLNGFETKFTFQITDHSQSCVEVKDKDFGLQHHKSCAVHGGDGFAFVIHGDPSEIRALGKGGSGLGYGGLQNAVVVEFDTWYNGGGGFGDLLQDHISIHTNGHGVLDATSEASRVSAPRNHELADGGVHLVQIRYYGQIQPQYLHQATATEYLKPYLKDNNEGRRLGMLVVWVDDGIDKDIPLLAIPINLSITLKLKEDLAYVGFTSSTGNSWEKHDILSWHLCEEDTCNSVRAKRGSEIIDFDYHLSSKNYLASHGDETIPRASDKNIPYDDHYPDTRAWAKPQQHYASNKPTGPQTSAHSEVPHTMASESGSAHGHTRQFTGTG